MKIINIDQFSLYVDDEDYDRILKYPIYIEKSRKSYIVRLYINKKEVMLNKFLLSYPKFRIKHLDKNPFNFQKSNLVLITPEYRIKQEKEYYQKNKFKMNQRSLKWSRKNKDKIKIIQQKYRKSIRGREVEKIKKRTYIIKYGELKRVNKRRHPNTIFDITKEHYLNLMNQGCYYCKIDLHQFVGVCLDRIDNNIGYCINNVLPACGRCNRTRGDSWTIEETKLMIETALEFRKSQK